MVSFPTFTWKSPLNIFAIDHSRKIVLANAIANVVNDFKKLVYFIKYIYISPFTNICNKFGNLE